MSFFEKRKERYLYYFILSIAIKIIFDWLVLKCMPKNYMYSLTYDINYNVETMVIAWGVFLLVLIFTFYYKVKKHNDSISLLLIVLFYLYYIPMNSISYLQNRSLGFLILSSIFWCCLVFISEVKLSFNGKKLQSDIQVDTGRLVNSKAFYLICVAMDVACILYVYKYNGLKLTLDIINVYDARASYVGTTSIFESILENFGGGFLITLSMYLGLKYRKYFLFIVGLFAQVALFSAARQKGTLLIIGIVIAIFLLDKLKGLKMFKPIVPFGIFALCLVALIEYLVVGSNLIFTLFIRRLMFIPAWLNSLYYDFFQTHKLLLFSQDVFLVERLGVNVYDDSILSMINNTYFSGYMASPNTGLFAEAYMHFGIVGTVVFPIMDIVLLRLLFGCMNHYDEGIRLLVVLEVAIMAVNLPLTSGIFSVTFYFIIPITYLILILQKRY